MIPFDEAAAMLDEEADALPPELFRELNGGVNLLPDARQDENGLSIMGMYIHNAMGRYIEIYYGSFAALYAGLPAEALRRKLRQTLHHELTHHVESLAGDRSLEKWDERHVAELLAGVEEEVCIDSVLFVDGGGVLAAAAWELFRFELKRRGDAMDCAFARLFAEPEPPGEAAIAAAGQYGVDIRGAETAGVTRALMEKFDAAMCMTGAQADELAERFPEFEAKIFLLGKKDILPPKRDTVAAWARVVGKLYGEIENFLDELNDGEYDEQV